MQKKIITILKYTFFLGLGVFLVWWSLRQMTEKDYFDFLHSLKTANYTLLLPVFFILTLSHISRAIRWKILMGSMGYNPKLSNTFCAVMIGYLANFAFPRLGEILKCTILSKYEKVPADKLVGTILVERAIDLFCFFIIIIISLLTQAKVVGAYAKQKFQEYFLTHNKEFALIKIAVMLLVLIGGIFLLNYIFKKFVHIKLVQKLKGIYNGVIEGLLSVKKLKNKWRFIFYTILIWGCYLTGTYLGFFAMKETSSLPILSSFPILVAGALATIITPGGIGSYPELLMKAMKLYDIPDGYGYANGWLQWSAQFVIILFWGFICVLILPYLNKNKNEIGASNTQ